mmetsp:Transcript_4194/g.10605  ORF Transcript_4194/g.10605 Transcript_4194/m.10605 type:complete len:286 (+) Transcript_4194:412-1269(+)
MHSNRYVAANPKIGWTPAQQQTSSRRVSSKSAAPARGDGKSRCSPRKTTGSTSRRGRQRWWAALALSRRATPRGCHAATCRRRRGAGRRGGSTRSRRRARRHPAAPAAPPPPRSSSTSSPPRCAWRRPPAGHHRRRGTWPWRARGVSRGPKSPPPPRPCRSAARGPASPARSRTVATVSTTPPRAPNAERSAWGSGSGGWRGPSAQGHSVACPRRQSSWSSPYPGHRPRQTKEPWLRLQGLVGHPYKWHRPSIAPTPACLRARHLPVQATPYSRRETRQASLSKP